jgi:uncharacterized protein (TIGR00106 family)
LENLPFNGVYIGSNRGYTLRRRKNKDAFGPSDFLILWSQREEVSMSMLVEFSVVPVGVGVSISPQIARVLKIVAESGVNYKANPMGTVLEGDWDTVMAVVRKCHDAVMKDSERALTTIDRRPKRQNHG